MKTEDTEEFLNRTDDGANPNVMMRKAGDCFDRELHLTFFPTFHFFLFLSVESVRSVQSVNCGHITQLSHSRSYQKNGGLLLLMQCRPPLFSC